MVEWFNSLDSFFQAVLIVASTSTIVMLVQLILLIVGIGVDSTFDGDMGIGDACDSSLDTDGINDTNIIDIFGLKILTIRNLFVFLAMGGWTMVILFDATKNYPISIIFGILIGIAMVFLCSFAMKKAMKLQSSGNVLLENAVGKVGTVYLSIPANKAGKGKINVLVQERYEEFDAVTENEAIPTGTEVYVKSSEDSYLVVEKKN